jgi:hypothetical protein
MVMARWAVFKDHRGIPYCEPVNEDINVFVCDVKACPEQRHWLTQKIIIRKQEAHRLIKIRLNERRYSKKRYMASAFESVPASYVFRKDIRYLEENRWGPVQVLLMLEHDDPLGLRLQYEFKGLAGMEELLQRLIDCQ